MPDMLSTLIVNIMMLLGIVLSLHLKHLSMS
jgi:hypothetical protein